MTFRARLQAALVAAVLLPLVVTGVLVLIVYPARAVADETGRVQTARDVLVDVLDEQCQQVRLAAQLVAEQVAAGRSPEQAAGAVVQQQSADEVLVRAPDGTALAAAGRGTSALPIDVGDCRRRDGMWGMGLVAQAQVVGVPSAGQTSMVIAVRRFDGEGLARLSSTVGTDLALLARDDAVLRSTHDVLSSDQVPAGTAAERVGSRVVAATPEQPGIPRLVAVGQQLPPRGRLVGLVLAVLLVVLLLALWGGRWLAALATQPLDELAETTSRMASGDLDVVADTGAGDEVSQLAATFNAMTEDLRDYVEEVRVSRDRLRANFTLLGDTLSATHDLPRILQVVTDAAASSLDADQAVLLLAATEGGQLQVAAHHEMPDQQHVRPGDGVLGRAAASTVPLRGFIGERGLEPAPGEPQKGYVLTAPLAGRDRVHGVLSLYRPRAAAPFSVEDQETVRSFAAQTVVAIDNVRLHDETRRLSLTDAMTGLWNFRYLTGAMSRELERAHRFGRPLSLLLVDIDHFKRINDTYGHQQGDAVLVEVTRRIAGVIREVDMLARYGGEEFLVILPETDRDGAVHAAERVLAAMRGAPIMLSGGRSVGLTVSVGVSVFPEDANEPEQLVAQADKALYRAKTDGRDRLAVAADRADGALGADGAFGADGADDAHRDASIDAGPADAEPAGDS